MSDEEVLPQESEVPAQEEVQVDPIEAKAAEMGWKPREQWDGNPNEWRDARTFIDRGELLQEIHKLKRRDRDYQAAMNDMKSMLSGAEKKGREAAIAELKEMKVQALERGEYKRVADIDEQIAETKSQAKETVSGDVPQDVYVEYAKEWMPNNPWFAADAELRDDFETVIRGYVSKEVQRNGTTPDPEEAFKHATDKIRRMYPDKFKPTQRAAATVASPTTTTTRTATAKSKKSWNDLSEDQKKVGSRLVQLKTFTREEYIAELEKAGEL